MAQWWEQDQLDTPNQATAPQQNWWEEDVALIEDTGQSPISSAAGAAGQGLLSVASGTLGGVDALGSIVGMGSETLRDASQSITEFGERYSPVNPLYAQSFPVQAAGAVGQAAGQLATLPVGGVAGKLIGGAAGAVRGAQLTGLGSGALMGADAGQDTADRLGIENRAQRAALILGQAGIELGTEMLGGFGSKQFTEGILGRVADMPWRNPSFLSTALAEGGEEVIAGTAQPLLERGVLLGQDAPSGVELTGIPLTSVDATLDVLKQGALGAVAGGFMGGVNSFLNRPEPKAVLDWRLRAKARINELSSAPQLTEEEQSELNQLQTEDQNATEWLQNYGESNIYEPLRQVVNPVSDWRNQRESLIADTEDQAGKQELRRQTNEEIEAATEILERGGNPFSPEVSTAALDEALSPPDPVTETAIRAASNDPVVVETKAVADEVDAAGAPATATVLKEQADLKAAENVVVIKQSNEPSFQQRLDEIIRPTGIPLPKLPGQTPPPAPVPSSDSGDLSPARVIGLVGQLFTDANQSEIADLPPQVRSIYERMPQEYKNAFFRQSSTSRGIQEAEDFLDDDAAQVVRQVAQEDPLYGDAVRWLNDQAYGVIDSTTVQDETQTTLTEDDGQPIPSGASSQGQPIQGGDQFANQRSDYLDDEEGLRASRENEERGFTSGNDAGETASAIPPVDASVAFESALRKEAKDLPKWTDERVAEAVEWFRNGKQGDPPWGKPVVTRAVLAVDSQARSDWNKKEQELLRRFKRADVQDQADVDDVQAKQAIERERQSYFEIPSEELSLSAPFQAADGMSNGELAREIRNVKADFESFKQAFREELSAFQNSYRELSSTVGAQAAWRELEQSNPAGAELYDRYLNRAVNLSRLEAQLEQRGLNPDEPIPEGLEDFVPKVQKERNKPLKKGAANSIQDAWTEISKSEDSFRGKKSTAKDPNTLAQEMSGGKVRGYVDADGDVVFRSPNGGQLSIVDSDSTRPTIWALSADSEGKARGGGSQLYQIAFAWAHNNGKKIFPSNNLTSINAYVRRTSNMLSSALRYGSTKHLLPDADQRISGWRNGDDKGNIARLAWRESQQVLKAIPQASNIRYDFQTGDFYTQTPQEGAVTQGQAEDATRPGETPNTSTGRVNLSPQDLEAIVTESLDGGYANELGIGETTLKRAIITNTAAQEQASGSVAAPQGILYSQQEGEDTGATLEDAQKGLQELRSTELGSLMANDVVIVQSLPELREVTANRPFSEEVYGLLNRAEGFFRPSTGESYVILDRVKRLNGESYSDAVKRIIFHERAFHGGFKWMYQNDPSFARQAMDVARMIPKAERDALRDYPGIGDSDIAMLEEWLARKLQQEDPNELAQRDPLFKRIWQAIKDLVARVLGKPVTSEYVDREARRLVGEILRNREAFGNQAMSADEDIVAQRDVDTSTRFSIPFSQREADLNIEQLKQEAGFHADAPNDMVALHQVLGQATDQPYIVQRIRPQADFVRQRIWTGGLDENGNPLVNEENTRNFWRQNDLQTSDPNWAANLQDDFREMASQSTESELRNNRAEAIGSIAQLELMNYAQLMAANDATDAQEAVDAIRRGRYANDITLLRYASISGSARALNARAQAARNGMMGFWNGLNMLEDKNEKEVSTTVGKGNVKKIQEAVNNPQDQDIDTRGIENPPEVEAPTAPQILGIDEEAIVDWRTELEQDGVDRMVDSFFRGGDGPQSQAGPLIEGSNWLNQTLSQLMNEQLDAMGIERKEGGKQIISDRIVRELGLSDVRSGKLKEFSSRLVERINEVSADNPELARRLMDQWEQVTSFMRDNTLSGSLSRRAVHDILRIRREKNRSLPRGQLGQVASIQELISLTQGAQAQESLALVNEIINGIKESSRMTDLRGNDSFISDEKLNAAKKSVQKALDFLMQEQRSRAAKAAKERAQRLQDELNNRPNKEASDIINRIDQQRTEWVGPERSKSKIRAMKEEAVSTDLTDPSRPGYLSRTAFIQRYAQAFEQLGVQPVTANALSSRLYEENRRLKTDQFIREMDARVRAGGINNLAKDLLSDPINILADPALMREKMIEWLKGTGLTEEQASRWAKRHEKTFREKLIKAKEKALDRAIKGVKTITTPSVERIRQAIRAGALDPVDGVRNALAEALGAKGLTKEDLQKMAAADLIMRDAQGARYMAELAKIRDILASKSPELTWLNRTTQAWILSVLGGVNTISLGATVPAFAGITRLGLNLGYTMLNGVRGRIPKGDIPSALAADLGDYVDSYRSYIDTFRSVWKNDETMQYHAANLNAVDSLRADFSKQMEKIKTGTPIERVKAALKSAQSSTDLVRRVMNALDGASISVFQNLFFRQESRKALQKVGMSPQEISNVFTQAWSHGKEVAEGFFSRGQYDEQTSARIGIDASMDYLQEYMKGRLGSETAASQVRDFSVKEAAYELGVLDPEKIATWDVFYQVTAAVQALTRDMARRNPLLGRLLFGFTSLPLALSNRSLSFTPYGLLRVYWKNRELNKGDNEQYMSTMGSELQRRQRKIEGIAGSMALLILGALAYAGSDDDDENYTGIKFTLNGPKDPSDRDSWIKKGFKPNSIMWVQNGKPLASVNYARGTFESLKLPLIAIGAIEDMKLNGELQNGNIAEHSISWLKSSAAGGLEALAYFGLKNVSSALQLADARASEASIASQLGWTTAGFVPWSGFAKSLQRPFVGQLDQSSAQAAILAQFPLTMGLYGQPSLNSLGDQRGAQPVDLFNKLTDRAYLLGLPLQISMSPDSANARAYELFVKKGASPTIPSRSRLAQSNGHITDFRWQQYVKLRGSLIKEAVYKRYNELSGMARADFEDAISTISSAATKNAKKRLRLN